MKHCKLNDSPANMRLMRSRCVENKKEPTVAEAHIIQLLNATTETYTFEKGLFNQQRFYIVDFYFPKPRKLCLEIDGSYHNRQVFYDAVRDDFIRTKRRMKMVRITNEQALLLTSETLLALINQYAPLRPPPAAPDVLLREAHQQKA